MVRHGKSEQKNWAETGKILKESGIIKAYSIFLKLSKLS